MKIRNGFVSNSSSSSFIVAFEKPLEDYSVEEMQKLLFGDAKELSCYDASYSTLEIANQVKNGPSQRFENVKMFSDNKDLLDIITSGWYDGKPEYPRKVFELKGEERQKYWDIYYEIDNATAESKLQRFVMSSFVNRDDFDKEPVFYVFEYSDNDGGFMAMMEHGDIFDNLPHMTVSHH